jgi:cytochrome c
MRSRAGHGLDVAFKKGEQMLRTWVIAGIALAASSGPTLAQDAAAGEQVFKRLCSPCHEIGEGAKIKLGPPLNGIDGRKSGTFDGFNYSPANKSSGITWSEESFPKYIRAPMQESFREAAPPRWRLTLALAWQDKRGAQEMRGASLHASPCASVRNGS